MKSLDPIFQAYKKVLLAHIQTKASEPLFHEHSVKFYETLFDVFHLIYEKQVDTELVKVPDCDVLIQDAYDAIESVKEMVTEFVHEDNEVGMDNLLRGLVDRLDGICGDARGFIEEEKEEVVEKKDVKPIQKPIQNSLNKIGIGLIKKV